MIDECCRKQWVINEPRAALLASSYLALMERPLCVIVYRHPLSFARASMRRRFSSWTAFEVPTRCWHASRPADKLTSIIVACRLGKTSSIGIACLFIIARYYDLRLHCVS
jgi:hypothetical protein